MGLIAIIMDQKLKNIIEVLYILYKGDIGSIYSSLFNRGYDVRDKSIEAHIELLDTCSEAGKQYTLGN